MNNLKELVNYLKTLNSGASMGELKEKFPDDDASLKQFIKSGLDLGSIVKEGEKRGTRYYAEGKKVVVKEKEIEYKNDGLEHNDLEAYLNSDKPIIGQAVITVITKFGRPNESLKHFLNSGMTVESIYVHYSKALKKNVIFEKITNTHYNKIQISRSENMFVFTKYNMQTSKNEIERFKLYEDLREHIRAVIL